MNAQGTPHTDKTNALTRHPSQIPAFEDRTTAPWSPSSWASKGSKQMVRRSMNSSQCEILELSRQRQCTDKSSIGDQTRLAKVWRDWTMQQREEGATLHPSPASKQPELSNAPENPLLGDPAPRNCKALQAT
ncbi:hypothetical protein MHU86_19593 [Fragilaria crotonensis]|nr:hypothetical protein MHU86_19593 [Fragilaria crotonensis]